MPKLDPIFGALAAIVSSVAISVISACGTDSAVGTAGNPGGGGGTVTISLPTGVAGGTGGATGGGSAGTQVDVWPPAGYRCMVIIRMGRRPRTERTISISGTGTSTA
jgi:hypothetical protein